MSLQCNGAPSTSQILAAARILFKVQGEDAVMAHLAEMASHDFQCPDRCDRWAVEFYNDNEGEIEGREAA